MFIIQTGIGLLQTDWRDQIIGWRDSGNTYKEIIDKCLQQGRQISKSRVHHILHKEFVPRQYQSTSLNDRKKFFAIRDLVLTSYLDDSQATLASIIVKIDQQFNEKVITSSNSYFTKLPYLERFTGMIVEVAS